MEKFQPFLIANYKVGLERDMEPWLLPEEAFPTLEDAYVFRGRVKRRRGFEALGQLSEQNTQTVGPAPVAGQTTFAGSVTVPAGTTISPGTVTIEIIDSGPPVTVVQSFQDVTKDGTFALTPASPGSSISTIDYLTGAFNLFFNALPAPIGVYSLVVRFGIINCRPVMGLCSQELNNINFENTIAFDTVKANVFDQGTQAFQDISFANPGGAPISWTGGDADFFWCTNYFTETTVASAQFGNPLFWAVNNVVADGIRYYNGDTTAGWTTLRPDLNIVPNRFLETCRILIPYKDRLIALNTQETVAGTLTNFRQRARFSQIGDPTIAATSWLDDTPGRGGFIDAPTSEQIISAAFYKDTLIVYFERSTWRLAYTGDFLTGPFQWERINSEFGAESTFSPIVRDNGVFAVGDRAITIATSAAVQRIDQLIPDEVFKIHNEFDGPQRVHGIRDFFPELVYWTFPSAARNTKFPDRLLVLNYREGSYAIFNDSFTTLGEFQDLRDVIWAQLPFPWQTYEQTWSSARNQSQFPKIIGGTPQGFVHILNAKISNDPCLCITDITQPGNTVQIESANHNFKTGQLIRMTNVQGLADQLIVGENTGTALNGSTSFTGTLTTLPVAPGSVTITVPTVGAFVDNGLGVLILGANRGTINYTTGTFTVNYPALVGDQIVTANYGQSGINGRCFQVRFVDDDNFLIFEVVGDDQFVDFPLPGASPYVANTGSAIPLNNINILTKRFNPFVNEARSQRTGELDIFLDRTSLGEISMEVYQYEQQDQPIDTFIILTRAEAPTFANQELMSKIWHRVFINAISEFLQFRIKLTDTQLCDENIGNSDIVLHAMILHSRRDGRLVGF